MGLSENAVSIYWFIIFSLSGPVAGYTPLESPNRWLSWWIQYLLHNNCSFHGSIPTETESIPILSLLSLISLLLCQIIHLILMGCNIWNFNGIYPILYHWYYLVSESIPILFSDFPLWNHFLVPEVTIWKPPYLSGDGWLKSRFGPGEHREFFLAGVFGSMLGTPLRGRIVSPKDEFHLGWTRQVL